MINLQENQIIIKDSIDISDMDLLIDFPSSVPVIWL